MKVKAFVSFQNVSETASFWWLQPHILYSVLILLDDQSPPDSARLATTSILLKWMNVDFFLLPVLTKYFSAPNSVIALELDQISFFLVKSVLFHACPQ